MECINTAIIQIKYDYSNILILTIHFISLQSDENKKIIPGITFMTPQTSAGTQSTRMGETFYYLENPVKLTYLNPKSQVLLFF